MIGHFTHEHPYILGVVVVSLVCLAVRYIERLVEVPYPPDIPLLREPFGTKRFSWRTRVAAHINYRKLLLEAYENYSTKGQPVMIPGIGLRKELIMPVSSMRWVMAQPDSCLDLGHALETMTMVRWNLGYDNLVADPWQSLPVKFKLNDAMKLLLPALVDEIPHALETHLGADTENWKTVNLLSTIRLIVAELSARFIVGLPLSRNPDYIKTVLSLNTLFVVSAGVTSASPQLLQPIVGTMFRGPTSYYLNKMKTYLLPVLNERLENLKHQTRNAEKPSPRDYLDMMLDFAAKKRPNEATNQDILICRIALQTFASSHFTSMLITNLILNILASDAEFNSIAVLRDECSRVLDNQPSSLTRARASQMVHIDSIARETARFHSFSARSVLRRVMRDDVTTDDGYSLPRGTLLSFASLPQYQAGGLGEKLKFDPFRFSKQGEEKGAEDGPTPPTPTHFVSASPEYLPFGNGRRTCPGRFVVDMKLKIVVTELLHRYDVKLADNYRPGNYEISEALYPPQGAEIMIKRRDLRDRL